MMIIINILIQDKPTKKKKKNGWKQEEEKFCRKKERLNPRNMLVSY